MKFAKIIKLAIPLLLASVVCAQSTQTTEPVMKNAQAIAAKARHEKALKDAQDAYIKAQQKAHADYITVLDTARMHTFKAENASEVEALSKEKIRVQEEQKGLEQVTDTPLVQTRSVTGSVPASKDWTKVTEVKKGQVLEITATGTWRGHHPSAENDPDGIRLMGENVVSKEIKGGALIGKVGEKSEAFLVGKSATYTVENDGTLFMGPNVLDRVISSHRLAM